MVDQPPMGTFIIAEAGVNHNGSESLALELVDAAASSGADAVKFQTFSADRLTRKGAQKAAYQERAIGSGDQYDMLKALELSETLHHSIIERCQKRNIEFMSTGFDERSVDFLVGLGIKRIKVPSGEITNLPYLRHVAQFDLPLIVSTGMASLEEVVDAVACIKQVRPLADRLTLLHCTSNYPTQPKDVNLRAMLTMGDAAKQPIGYSDHTLGIAVSVAAVAMGATIIEKHFTLDRSLPGPDHAASLTPGELTDMITSIRQIEAALGDGIKQPTASELPVRAVVRKSVTSIAPIAKGEVFSDRNLALLRPGDGIPPAEFENILGRTATRDIAAGETLAPGDVLR